MGRTSGGGAGGGGTQFVHGRSRMIIDPRIRTMPGRRVFTNQADIACTKREVCKVFGESHEG